MQTSLFLAFLALLNVSLAFPLSIATLFHRQAAVNTAVSCEEYSSIANYTVIANNSTLRASFIQSSPTGTDAATGIIDTAAKSGPVLQFDKELNTKCGNLTTIAFTEAANNFSMGIVAGFKIKGAFAKNSGERVGGAAWATVVLVAGVVGAGLM